MPVGHCAAPFVAVRTRPARTDPRRESILEDERMTISSSQEGALLFERYNLWPSDFEQISETVFDDLEECDTDLGHGHTTLEVADLKANFIERPFTDNSDTFPVMTA